MTEQKKTEDEEEAKPTMNELIRAGAGMPQSDGEQEQLPLDDLFREALAGQRNRKQARRQAK